MELTSSILIYFKLMSTNKKAVLMISLGTPDSPGWFDVASYLRQFLSDARIVNIPSFFRFLLVNLIIVPFRSFSSAKSYKELWTDRGSPLKYHMEDLTLKVQEKLKDTHDVFYAMRYKNPSIKDKLKELDEIGYDEVVLFPIFPQYSSAANGSFLEYSLKQIAKWNVIPSVKTVDQFYDNEDFLDAFAENIMKFDLDDYDKVMFSYHGLPMSLTLIGKKLLFYQDQVLFYLLIVLLFRSKLLYSNDGYRLQLPFHNLYHHKYLLCKHHLIDSLEARGN